MESPHGRSIDIPIKGKALEQLTSVEKQEFIDTALAERDKFVAWAEKQKDPLAPKKHPILETFKHAPSNKIMIATLSAIGLANIGFGLAADKLGLNNGEIGDLWAATFGAPILEETIFRSKKMPHFITWAGNQLGITIRPDKARLATAAIFTGVEAQGGSFLNAIFKAGLAPFLQKMAQEKGLAASITAHALFNATLSGIKYLSNDNVLKQMSSVKNDKDIKAKLATYYVPMILMSLSLLGIYVSVGVAGIKEIFDDKHINDVLDQLRRANSSNPINSKQVYMLANRLLAYPSTDGYKFQAGVELGYVDAALNMPNMLKDVMTPDDYARTQVHRMVTEVWKDPKTLPYRLEKANKYISEQIAARST